MNQNIVKFLEFKGKNIVYLSANGTYWIAIKPVCEAINVDYIQQYKNLRADAILAPALCKHTMQVPKKDAFLTPALSKQPMQVSGNDQFREYVCLPERLIYGWIFSIRSKSKELQEYKMECYDILYNHFHGTITRRRELIKERVLITNQRRTLEHELAQNENFRNWEALKAAEARNGKQIRESERGEIQEEMNLFSQINIL